MYHDSDNRKQEYEVMYIAAAVDVRQNDSDSTCREHVLCSVYMCGGSLILTPGVSPELQETKPSKSVEAVDSLGIWYEFGTPAGERYRYRVEVASDADTPSIPPAQRTDGVFTAVPPSPWIRYGYYGEFQSLCLFGEKTLSLEYYVYIPHRWLVVKEQTEQFELGLDGNTKIVRGHSNVCSAKWASVADDYSSLADGRVPGYIGYVNSPFNLNVVNDPYTVDDDGRSKTIKFVNRRRVLDMHSNVHDKNETEPLSENELERPVKLRVPVLYCVVYSHGAMSSKTVEAYGWSNMPTTPGRHVLHISTWRPHTTVTHQSAEYFTAMSQPMSDLSYVSVPMGLDVCVM